MAADAGGRRSLESAARMATFARNVRVRAIQFKTGAEVVKRILRPARRHHQKQHKRAQAPENPFSNVH